MLDRDQKLHERAQAIADSMRPSEGAAQIDLPRYRCHKTVRALKIAALEVMADKSATIAPLDHRYAAFATVSGWAERFAGSDGDPGYYVVYADGFASWSPSKVFEGGYSLIV